MTVKKMLKPGAIVLTCVLVLLAAGSFVRIEKPFSESINFYLFSGNIICTIILHIVFWLFIVSCLTHAVVTEKHDASLLVLAVVFSLIFIIWGVVAYMEGDRNNTWFRLFYHIVYLIALAVTRSKIKNDIVSLPSLDKLDRKVLSVLYVSHLVGLGLIIVSCILHCVLNREMFV